jgi:hypothetical protein
MHLDSYDSQATQDLDLLRSTHAHALLVGPGPAVDAALATIESGLRPPVVAWTPSNTPEPPMLTSGTLIVRNLAELERDQQQRFLSWVDEGHGGVQVISTSGGHMWSLVERGVFLTSLYYRLGVVCVDLTDAPQAEPARAPAVGSA